MAGPNQHISDTIGLNFEPRQDLTEVLIDRDIHNSAKFIQAAWKVAPPVPVDKENGRIPALVGGETQREVYGERGEGGSYPRTRMQITETLYDTYPLGWEAAIDRVKDYSTRRFIDLESKNSERLLSQWQVGIEAHVARAAEDYDEYPDDNKETITVEANNWLTGTNCRVAVQNKADALFTLTGAELEQYSLTLPISFIRKFIYIDDISDNLKYTTPIQTMSLKTRLMIIREYLGVKEVIPVAGRGNTRHFRDKTKKPFYARLWDQSTSIMFLASDGGDWDYSFMRRPLYDAPLGGNEFMMEQYEEMTTDTKVLRLKTFTGVYVDYDLAHITRQIDYVDP